MIEYLIGLPVIVGILCLIIPKKIKGVRETLALVTSLVIFILTIFVFLKQLPLSTIHYPLYANLFRLDNLSSFILLAIGLFGFLVTLYSLSFMKGKEGLNHYYAYLLWTIGASCGAVLANHLILLLVFWGFLGLTLYLLIGIGGPEASQAAKKTLVIIGGSDCLMLLGIALIYYLTGTFQMDKIRIDLPAARYLVPSIATLPIVAYICLAIASFAKAGAMPMHTWIPDMAETAPVSVTAFLPASLDKLLGIYLLARISMNLFIMNKAMGLLLLIVGAVTIIAAVMMALIQHDLKRLLSYHAVSQVGYMVLGIGTGNPVGIAGGIFHMLNHAIYKACLFLCGGSVEHRMKTSDLSRLGGLVKFMPVTFITCLIAALSISGVPPFNGFVSKWMVYQGLVELGRQGDKLWVIWLVAAMFGSALTLASFMKVMHAVFLGQPSEELRIKDKGLREVNPTMWVPMVVLAILCVIFGVFAYRVPLKMFILPSLKAEVIFSGIWRAGLATILIFVGIAVGILIYLMGRISKTRESDTFVGGELLEEWPEMRVSGTEFYNTIQDIGPLGAIYNLAKKKIFDIYEICSKITFVFTKILRYIHNGVLPSYLVWCFLGMIVIFYILLR